MFNKTKQKTNPVLAPLLSGQSSQPSNSDFLTTVNTPGSVSQKQRSERTTIREMRGTHWSSSPGDETCHQCNHFAPRQLIQSIYKGTRIVKANHNSSISNPEK